MIFSRQNNMKIGHINDVSIFICESLCQVGDAAPYLTPIIIKDIIRKII